MTNSDVIEIAMAQSAIDSNCRKDDFKSNENKVVISAKNSDARRYLELPFYCDLTSYGNNIVASVSDELAETVSSYICKYSYIHCFETPNLIVLQEKLKPFDLNVCFMAEYFLPDMDIIQNIPCKYTMKILEQKDFSDLYRPEWSNALCEKRKELDVLGVAAFDGDKMIGFAACSADCETMWQIGIDVLPEYRRKGIASSLTSTLAAEVIKRGKVPFYCSAWSNIRSVKNAIRSGFRPAWVQVTAKKNSMISDMNK